jgi:hypothetical protein
VHFTTTTANNPQHAVHSNNISQWSFSNHGHILMTDDPAGHTKLARTQVVHIPN